MTKIKLNPISAMLIAFFVWPIFMLAIVAPIIGLFGYGEASYALALLLYTVFLLPMVCMVVFNLSLIKNRMWVRKHLWSFRLINLFLIAWIINSIIALIYKDSGLLWFKWLFE